MYVCNIMAMYQFRSKYTYACRVAKNYYRFLKRVRTHRKRKATAQRKKETTGRKNEPAGREKEPTGRKNKPAGRKSERRLDDLEPSKLF